MPSFRHSIAWTGRTLLVLGLGFALVLPLHSANAAHAIYSPNVEEGETAIEMRGHYTHDSDPAINGSQQYKLEVEHAPTSRWLTAVVGEFEKEPNESLQSTAIEWENILQLTEQGAHWLDVGVVTAISRERGENVHDKFEVGALFEKNIGRQAINLNLVAEHEMGGESETELEYAARWRWRRAASFEPAIELHGELGDIDHLGSFVNQNHSAGPGFVGKVTLSKRRKLSYQAVYLVGLTNNSPSGTAVVRFELEF